MGWKFDYIERPKQFDDNQIWEQVRRTIDGKPINNDQLQLIFTQILTAFSRSPKKSLLDLGCGNGALTKEVDNAFETTLGIDISDHLINIANKYFSSENRKFLAKDIRKFTKYTLSNHYSHCLLYGVSSFLNDMELEILIHQLIGKGLKNIFIGNVRNIEKAEKFYKKKISFDELKDFGSSMGAWRNKEYFQNIIRKFSNFSLDFLQMPNTFYASEYYFDVVIEEVN